MRRTIGFGSVSEQYVEREYIEEDYPNGLKVITNAETKLTFEIEKAITTGDMVDVIWTVTYPDYDAEMYDVDVLAKEYGVSSSTIYSKVSRAKKKVRKNHGRLEEHV